MYVEIILFLIVLTLLFVVLFQDINYSRLEKRFYEVKDEYLNSILRKRLFQSKKYLRYDENQLYKNLINLFGEKFRIIPQVHLSDLAEVKMGYRDHDNLYYELKRIIYDYVLFNENFEPLVAIELNGVSHFASNRINRDSFSRNIVDNLNFSLVEFEKKDIYNKEKIYNEIEKLLR